MLNLICSIFTLYLYNQTFYQLSIFSSTNLLELWWLKFVCLPLAVHGNTDSESLAAREFWRMPKIPVVSRMIPDPRSGQTRPGSAVLPGQGFRPLSGCTVPVLCCPPCENNCSEPLRGSLWSCISPFAITQKSFAPSSLCLPFPAVWPPHCQTKPAHLLQPLLSVVLAPDSCQLGNLLTLQFLKFFLNCEAHVQYSSNLTGID